MNTLVDLGEKLLEIMKLKSYKSFPGVRALKGGLPSEQRVRFMR